MPENKNQEQDVLERACRFVETVVRGVGLKAEVSAEKRDDYIQIDVEGDELGLLIGRHGDTLLALQYLTSIAANKDKTEARERIIIDIAGYRERRRESLEQMAIRMAEKALYIGEPVPLQPMNAFERRIIHLALRDNDKVTTLSEGEEPDRKVIIEPK